MTKQHYIHKKWVQALVLVLLLASCGEKTDTTNLATNSNTGKAGATELINGISVPLEPDPIVNNATLVGIDTNGNGVRDDVERKIAANAAIVTTNIGVAAPTFSDVKTVISFELKLDNSRAYTNLLSNPNDPAVALKAFTEISCFDDRYWRFNSFNFHDANINSVERESAYLSAYAIALKNGLPITQSDRSCKAVN